MGWNHQLANHTSPNEWFLSDNWRKLTDIPQPIPKQMFYKFLFLKILANLFCLFLFASDSSRCPNDLHAWSKHQNLAQAFTCMARPNGEPWEMVGRSSVLIITWSWDLSAICVFCAELHLYKLALFVFVNVFWWPFCYGFGYGLWAIIVKTSTHHGSQNKLNKESLTQPMANL